MRMKKCKGRKMLAILLVLLITLGMMPASIFATNVEDNSIIALTFPEKRTYIVDKGTKKGKIGLPSKLTATIEIPAAEDEDEPIIRKRTLSVIWTGDYDAYTEGVYTLTAEFKNDIYSFDEMPVVTVWVQSAESSNLLEDSRRATPTEAARDRKQKEEPQEATPTEPLQENVVFQGVEDRIVTSYENFDAMQGVVATADEEVLDVVITDVISTDPDYTYVAGAHILPIGEEGYTYTLTYTAYAQRDVLHLSPLGRAFRILTSDIPFFAAAGYTPGELNFLADGGILSSALTYNIQDDTHGTFTVRYVPGSAGTSNTVLLINWPEYGATIETLPSETQSGIAQVAQLDSHTLAIKLDNGLTDEFIVDIKLKTVALTQEQAKNWMDNGSLPPTSMKASEYNLPVGVQLEDVRTGGILHTAVTNCTVVPELYPTQNITATHTYDATVSSVGKITNQMLSQMGTYQSNNGYLYGPKMNGMLRYDIPTLHTGETPLMELTGIKIYCPDEKLELTGVGTTATHNGVRGGGRVLDGSDFDVQWGNWIVGARQTETAGANAGKSYYILTPPSRWFNIGSDGNLTAKFYGMRLIWQLRDETDELPYSPTAYTDFEAVDTEVLYQRVAEGSLPVQEVYTHTGPQIHTIARENTDALTHAYGVARHKDNIPDNNVVTGSYHDNEIYTFTNNTWYLDTLGGVKIEYVPTYTGGPLTQSFAFPLEIRPQTIHLTEASQNSTTDELNGKHTILQSLSYTLADGTTVNATQAEIDAINASFAQKNLPRTGGTLYYSAAVGEYSFASATEANPVTNVNLTWESMVTKYRHAYPFGVPVKNVISAQGANTVYRYSGAMYTVGVGFDYNVAEFHDLAKTNPIQDYEMAQVNYTFTAAGNTHAGANESNTDYLWFRLRTPACPDLYGEAVRSGGSFRRHVEHGVFADGSSTYSMGHIGFDVGGYGEKKDIITDPSFDLKVQFHSELGASYWTALSGNNNLSGITEAEGLAFLTGAFTAMPKLSGWNIAYETRDGNNGSVTVPTITDEAGEPFQIPLQAGDAFTSLKFSYTGDLELPHPAGVTDKLIIYLMKDIQLRALNENPFTGQALSTTSGNYSKFFVRLNAVLHSACNTHATGQEMHSPRAGYRGHNGFIYAPMKTMYFTRQAALSLNSARIPAGGQTVFQGSSVSDTWVPLVRPSAMPSSANEFITFDFTNGGSGEFPWGISEAVYIELTDPEFLVDLSNTSFYGISATDPNVITSQITVGGRTFLKMKFVDGYLRPFMWRDANQRFADNWQNSFTIKPGYYLGYGWDCASGPIKLGFRTLPGTTVGLHHPVGKIYLDFSELLDKYDAPNATGYDYNRTDYVFNNAVTDDLGLSDTASTQAKLFEWDSSSYAVNVVRVAAVGASVVPGKLQNFFDFATKKTAFTDEERAELNALVSLQAPINSGIYDMNTYIKIPRRNAPINWLDDSDTPHISTSEFDMFLRGAPEVVSSSGGVDITSNNLIYEYTSDPNPDENSTYTAAAPTTEAGWRAVTGIRIVAKEMPLQSVLNFRLNLSTDEKTALGSMEAFSGGSYKYRDNISATVFQTGILNRVIWAYEDIGITDSNALVFWDVHDENGLRGITTATGAAAERGVPGVRVNLYAPDGVTLIDSTTTGTEGKYTLHSYTSVTGQIIEIIPPTKTDIALTGGADTKLTLQSTAQVAASALDSDFDRGTNRLVLPKIPANGVKNISAGLIKLPQLSANDVTVNVGDTVNVSAVLRDFLGISMPTDSYNITFHEAADTSIATVAGKTEIVTGTAAQTTKTTTVRGVSQGTTTATLTTSNIAGDEITFTFNINVTMPYSDIKAVKTWNDNNNALNARPSRITWQLQRKIAGGAKENVGSPVRVGAPWTTIFAHQPDFDANGNAYIYSIEEAPVPNYTTTYERAANGDFKVINTLKTITVDGVKTWDEIGTGFVRPSSISLTLKRNGVAMTGAEYTKTVTNAAADAVDPNKWLYSFDNLLEFNPADGTAYNYSVAEAPFAGNSPGQPGYNYSTEENGMNVTNLYPAKKRYTVTKTWDHGNSGNTGRPVTISLYRDNALFAGELINHGTVTLDGTVDALEKTPWKFTFEVNSSDAEGHSFSIVETPISGYVAQVGAFTPDPQDDTHVNVNVHNVYTPVAVNYNPSVRKIINGTLPAGALDKEFTFTLSSLHANQPMPNGSTETGVNAVVSGQGSVNFGNITFTNIGTYEYSIQETDRSADPAYRGYGFDTALYKLSIEVSDPNADGNLVATPAITRQGNHGTETVPHPLSITNTYEPLPAAYTLGVNKIITGDPAVFAETFDFTLAANGAEPMPAGNGDKVSIAGEGYGEFGEISFTSPGSYTYTITETEPANADKVEGYTYNTTPRTVVITVVDRNGQLRASADSANSDISIANTFTMPKITVEGVKTWNGDFGGIYPTATINLWKNNADPAEGETPFMTAAITNGGTSYRFDNLPKYDNQGAEIVYTVTETPISGVDSVRAANDRDFVNTKLTPARLTQADLNITKTLIGNELPNAQQFEFTISRTDGGDANAVEMPTDTTVRTGAISVGSAAAVGFDDIIFNLPGEYSFTVSETDSGLAGITYAEPQNITVRVTQDASFRLAAVITTPASGGALTFTNTYTPAPAKITAADLTLTKVLEGSVLPDAQVFEFSLARTDGGDINAVEMPATTSITTEAIRNNHAPAIGFDDIIFKAAGVYTFSITETNSGINNMTYAGPQNITVRVRDINGVLSAAVTEPATGGALTFTNTYTPTPAVLTNAGLNVKKTIAGNELPKAESFTFTITRTDGGDANAVIMPSTNMITTEMITGGSAAAIGFEDIIFNEAGIYTFAIAESRTNIPGMTDASPQNITVEVKDNNGILEANVTVPTGGGALTFENTYSPDLALIGKAALNITKQISGNELPVAKAFKFTIERIDSGAADAVSMPADLNTETEAIVSGSTNPVGFGDIIFNAPGEYSFKIEESPSAVRGMKDAQPQIINVNVRDTGGILTASVTEPAEGGALTFINNYTPSLSSSEHGLTSLEYVSGVKESTPLIHTDPPVRKVISGDVPPEEDSFNFIMTALSYIAPEGDTKTMSPAKMPMPQGSVNGVKQVSALGAGSVEFGLYTYQYPGVYTYSITELEGNNAQYTYDKAVYTIQDTVIREGDKLTYSRQISRDGSSEAQKECLFTNKYTLPPATEIINTESSLFGDLTISKTVVGDLADKNQDFVFTLSINAEGSYSYTGSKTGSIANGGSLKLRHGERVTIKLPAGTSYTVRESDNAGYRVSSTGSKGVIAANATARAAFTNTKSSVPKTGDSNELLIGIAMMCLSLCGMLILLIANGLIRRVRRRKEIQ